MKAKILQLIPSPLPLKKTLAERILPSLKNPRTLPSSATAPALPSDDFSSGSNSSPAYLIGGGLSQSQSMRSSLSSSSSTVPIEIFEVHPHPASSILAYVDYGSDDFHRMNSTTATMNNGPDLNPSSQSFFANSSKDVPPSFPPPVSVFINNKDPQRQRIVVQNYKIRRTLKTISMMDISRDVIIYSSNSTNAKKSPTYIPKGEMLEMCQRLGYIQNISFLDVNSSFIMGGMMDTSIATAQSNPSFPITIPIETNDQSIDDWVCEKAPACLIIHFKSRILIYSIAHANSHINTNAAAPSYYSPILSPIRAHIGTKLLQNAKPSSSTSISILSPNLLAIGCSDGVIRFYNIIHQKIILAIVGPNGRSDPIVRMISTNPLGFLDMNSRDQIWDDNTRKFETIRKTDKVSAPINTKSYPQTTLKSRFITVYQSGDSFLWEAKLTINPQDGKVEEIKVSPPVCKFDFSWVDNTQSTSAPSSSISYPISVDHSRIVYDQVRDLILWTTISETLFESKHHIFVWDISPSSLSKNLLPSTNHGAVSEKHKLEIPSLRRLMSLIIPSNEFSEPVASECHVIAGLLHPSFSHSSIVSFIGTNSGELTLSVATYTQQELSSPLQKLVNYHHFNLLSLLRSTNERIVGAWNTVIEDKMRVFSIHACPQGDTVLLSTNIGTVFLQLEDELILRCGSRHVSVSVDSFGCHVGVGNGIIFVEESSLFYGGLLFKPHTAVPNPVGRISITDITHLYKSPPPLHKSNDFQNRPSRVPPRLLPSPSGDYLCAFWYAESRYEILHIKSLVSTVNIIKRQKEVAYSPAVDSGINVLSFAWIGDDDMFALLYPPEMSKETDGSVTVIKERKRNSSRRITEEEVEESTIYDPSNFLPVVEVKHLIGVSQSAVETSGGVGAATAVSLGDLQLRGRYSAVCLFGGPVLCVASILDQKDTGHVDGAAFFYNLREGLEDKKASSFVTVGPSLPFPNYVEWDEDGKLCAIVVGSRIFVYKSVQDTLTHLGSVQLGQAHEHDTNIQSVKFLHGSLYCSTESTVQVIFLGNLDDDEKTCEIDSFVLASSLRPCTNIPATIDPIPATAVLKNPCVLSYFYGSLLVSCASSLYSIPLNHPILRIGMLLVAGQRQRAEKWILITNPNDHESLALFLERRGEPELAVKLPGLSIATAVDLCLKYGLAEQLENIVEKVDTKRIRDVDHGCGIHGSCLSTVVSVGAFLLGLGKVELVRCMATECLTFGDERGRMEAFTLASLLIAVEPMDGQRLIKRAVGIGNRLLEEEGSFWPLGDLVKDYFLETKRDQLK